MPQTHEPVSWEAVTALGTAFTAMVVVVTAVVQDIAAVELVRSLQDNTFMRACRGAIPFDVAEELVGGLVVGAWRRIKAVAV